MHKSAKLTECSGKLYVSWSPVILRTGRSNMWVCVCECVCGWVWVCVWVCVWVGVFVCVCVCGWVWVWVWVCVWVCVFVCVCVCVGLCGCVCVSVCGWVWVCVCVILWFDVNVKRTMLYWAITLCKPPPPIDSVIQNIDAWHEPTVTSAGVML